MTLKSGFGYFRCRLAKTHLLKLMADTPHPMVKGVAQTKCYTPWLKVPFGPSPYTLPQ